jgi:hypothetical protein
MITVITISDEGNVGLLYSETPKSVFMLQVLQHYAIKTRFQGVYGLNHTNVEWLALPGVTTLSYWVARISRIRQEFGADLSWKRNTCSKHHPAISVTLQGHISSRPTPYPRRQELLRGATALLVG